VFGPWCIHFYDPTCLHEYGAVSGAFVETAKKAKGSVQQSISRLLYLFVKEQNHPSAWHLYDANIHLFYRQLE
jgi:hypothetical protein